MSDCIFCKIAAGDVPCEKISESENFLAFLDISPTNPGHTLIIPKKHVRDFTEFPERLGEEWFSFSKKVIEAIKKGLGVTDFNLGMNNGRFAGQIVFHQHTHLIPRKEKDGLEVWSSKPATPKELAEIQKQILSYL